MVASSFFVLSFIATIHDDGTDLPRKLGSLFWAVGMENANKHHRAIQPSPGPEIDLLPLPLEIKANCELCGGAFECRSLF